MYNNNNNNVWEEVYNSFIITTLPIVLKLFLVVCIIFRVITLQI